MDHQLRKLITDYKGCDKLEDGRKLALLKDNDPSSQHFPITVTYECGSNLLNLCYLLEKSDDHE